MATTAEQSRVADAMADIRAGKMTQAKWDALTPNERSAARSSAGLESQLIGYEGFRVEVVDRSGETRRFIVSRSSGWIPCHIELARRDSSSGICVCGAPFQSVRKLYRVR